MKPEAVVRVKKDNCMPFVEATTAVQVVIEQKPKLQEKMTALIKELVKLRMQPSEDFLVVLGHQWLTIYERNLKETGVDHTRRNVAPQASDDEDDVDEID